MKRINLAYPFESIQGKQGIKQDLRYAENDNKAYASPEGKVNYARNYKPVMVAARIARTGLNYFAIKTKAATKNTAAWRLVAALMGAVSAIYGWVIKQVRLMEQLGLQYTESVTLGYEGTFHKWLCAAIRESLAKKSATIVVVGPTATITLGNNPFSDQYECITIAAKVLVKFWKQLTPQGITFKVGSDTGIAVVGSEVDTIIENTRLNVLGLSADASNKVKIGDKYLINADGDYIESGYELLDGDVFNLTDIAPEP